MAINVQAYEENVPDVGSQIPLFLAQYLTANINGFTSRI